MTDYAWLEFLREFRAEHPKLTFAEAKRQALISFRKMREGTP